MNEYQESTGGHERVSKRTRTAKKPTELKVAVDCLLYYVGMLAFGQPIGSFAACAERHYELYGIELTEVRRDLLDALRPLLIEGGVADLSCAELVLQLQTLGWRQDFLKREID